MPRPKTVSDAQITLALARIIGEHGPAKLTLALLAKEVGLAPATLIQRYGSKQALIEKAWSTGAGDFRLFVEQQRAAGRTPLAIVKDLYLCYADMASSPAAYINHLSAYLQLDIGDAVQRAHAVRAGLANDALVEGLLEEAVRAGTLVAGTDIAGLGRALASVTTGSLLRWATYRSGKPRAWLERDLDFVLSPWRA